MNKVMSVIIILVVSVVLSGCNIEPKEVIQGKQNKLISFDTMSVSVGNAILRDSFIIDDNDEWVFLQSDNDDDRSILVDVKFDIGELAIEESNIYIATMDEDESEMVTPLDVSDYTCHPVQNIINVNGENKGDISGRIPFFINKKMLQKQLKLVIEIDNYSINVPIEAPQQNKTKHKIGELVNMRDFFEMRVIDYEVLTDSIKFKDRDMNLDKERMLVINIELKPLYAETIDMKDYTFTLNDKDGNSYGANDQQFNDYIDIEKLLLKEPTICQFKLFLQDKMPEDFTLLIHNKFLTENFELKR